MSPISTTLALSLAASTLIGHRDPDLRATVVGCHDLVYDHGPLPQLDLPAHVRAGSGMAWVGPRLAVVQDDTLALGLFTPPDGAVHALPLPAPDGFRSFSKSRGNKAFKPDLEALVAFPGDRLVGFGSGSTERRDRLLVIEGARFSGVGGSITLRPARRLYDALRAATDFAGSELNLEGATIFGDHLVLLQRGNGAPVDGLQPADAVATMALADFEAFLQAPETAPVPAFSVFPYRLGDLGGVRLTFTDAAAGSGGALHFLAASEASPNTYDDGEVVGSALGVLTPGGPARWAPLTDASGVVLPLKAEGLALDPVDPSTAWVSLDVDDPDQPCQVCRIELSGPW